MNELARVNYSLQTQAPETLHHEHMECADLVFLPLPA